MTTHEMMIEKSDVAGMPAFIARKIAANFVAGRLMDESHAAAMARVDADVRIRALFEMLSAEAGMIVDALEDATFDGDVERAWSLVKDLDPEWTEAGWALMYRGVETTAADARDIIKMREMIASLKDAVRGAREIAG